MTIPAKTRKSKTEPKAVDLTGRNFPAKDGYRYEHMSTWGDAHEYGYRKDGSNVTHELVVLLYHEEKWCIKHVGCNCPEYVQSYGLGHCAHTRELKGYVNDLVFDRTALEQKLTDLKEGKI